MSANRTKEDDGLLGRWALVRQDERRDVLLAAAYFFLVLASYFVLKPLRDQLGVAGGVKNLKYLWTATLIGSGAASALFAALTSRFPRRVFVPIANHLCAATLIAFFIGFGAVEGEAKTWLARVFYVWLAVYAVFSVSVFWGFVVDVFGLNQARRLFGLIGIGGTLGAIAGPYATEKLATRIDLNWLFVVSAVLVELAVVCAALLGRRADRRATAASATARHEVPLSGNAWTGWKLVVGSKYLQGVATYTFLFGVVQTFITFQQNYIVEQAISGAVERTEYFASVEKYAQSLTLVVQLFLTARILRWIGFGGALIALPLIGGLGFAALGSAHMIGGATLGVVTLFWVLFRAFNNSTMKAAREALYVTTSREEKYKAKNVNDTFVFRAGDLLAAWGFDALKNALSHSLAGAAFAALPAAALWGAVGAWLGREEKRRERTPPS